MPLHGQYLRQLDKRIDMDATFSWLDRGHLSIETEGFVCAAQEQAILTRAIAKRIHGAQINEQCRVCGNALETVMHIATECSVLAPTEYMQRHNAVAQYLHFRLLQIHGSDMRSKQWYEHQPEKVTATATGKILWDFNIYTDRLIPARRPDIVVLNMKMKQGLILDVNCPHDANVLRNEVEKRSKYTDLKIELERIWGIHFTILPVVIGALGAVSKNIRPTIESLGLHSWEIGIMQDIVLKATCHILRKYVTQSGLPLINDSHSSALL